MLLKLFPVLIQPDRVWLSLSFMPCPYVMITWFKARGHSFTSTLLILLCKPSARYVGEGHRKGGQTGEDRQGSR